MKTKLITEAIGLYKQTLNHDSKWYAADLQDYITKINSLSVPELQGRINNLRNFVEPNSPMNKMVNREINKLDTGGMFNINTMKPINALD
jgi:methyl coenzyme M reductase alpha subunit